MGTQIKLGLLGNNIGRSRAKHLHELLGELNSLELTYLPIDLASRSGPVSIAEELELCRAQGFRGVNVTHPYKKAPLTTISHYSTPFHHPHPF